MAHSNESLEKKQALLLSYFEKIEELKKEQSTIRAKIAKAETRFRELLTAEADPAQLKLFDNLDEFLADKAA